MSYKLTNVGNDERRVWHRGEGIILKPNESVVVEKRPDLEENWLQVEETTVSPQKKTRKGDE